MHASSAAVAYIDVIAENPSYDIIMRGIPVCNGILVWMSSLLQVFVRCDTMCTNFIIAIFG